MEAFNTTAAEIGGLQYYREQAEMVQAADEAAAGSSTNEVVPLVLDG